jgi:hypothetical protein
VLRGLLPAVVAGLAACASPEAERAAVAPTSARRGETQAEALHRHGVNCMEVIEREQCAIENFERLVALDPPRRDLVGDAIFRLVDLYRRQGRDEEVKLLLRKFWAAGMRRGRSAVLPYGARYLDEHMTALVHVDLARLDESTMFGSLTADAKHWMFTCDEELRAELRARRKARREAARADRPQPDKTATEKRREERWEAGRKKAAAKPDPVYDEGLCQLARALGHDDLRAWHKFANAQNHLDPRLSMAVARIPDLDTELGDAVAAGSLTSVGDGVFALAGVEYEGEPVHVAKVDREEILLAPARLMPGVLAARDADVVRLRPDVRALAEQVPHDAVFFTVVTQEALVHGIEQSGTPLAALFPTPEGLLISAVAYDYAGVFVRMPTSDPLKVGFLVALARKLVEGASAEAEEEGDHGRAELMDTMDISQTDDGTALVVSVVLSRLQVEKMFT